jgi:hypothetical protein
MASRQASKKLGSFQGQFSSDIGLLASYTVQYNWNLYLLFLQNIGINSPRQCTNVYHHLSNSCENPQTYASFHVKENNKILLDSPMKAKIYFFREARFRLVTEQCPVKTESSAALV